MTFTQHIERQWDDYAERHRNRTNLLIHIVGVPVAWIGTFKVIGGLLLMLLGVPGAFGVLLWGLVVAGAAVAAQAYGDSLEAQRPEVPGAPAERAKRIAAEQYVNFPRFVLTGDWLRNFKAGA